MRTGFIASTLLACHLAVAGTGDVLRCIADIQDALDRHLADVPYDVTGQIIQPGIPGKYAFTANDGTASLVFGVNSAATAQCPTNFGDIVRIIGQTVAVPVSNQTAPPGILHFGADSRRIVRIGHATPPEPIDVTGKDFYGRSDLRNQLVRIKGTVHDTFRDEIDPKFIFLVLTCEGTAVYMAIRDDDRSTRTLDSFIGSTVCATGILRHNNPGCRTRLGRILAASSPDALSVVSSSGADPFAAPELSRSYLPDMSRPQNIERFRAAGHVIAVWNGGERILLRMADGDFVRADLKLRPPPRHGEHIEVVGMPETDLYHVNLSDAIWRATPGPKLAEESALPVKAGEIWINLSGQPYKNAWYHGHAVRLVGVVRSLPAVGDGKMYMESDSFMVPVDASSCPAALDGIAVGCTVEVTGTYITEIDPWLPTRIFPHVKDIVIAVRRPQDVKVVAYPPWWTPERLRRCLGALLAILFGIFAWNLALRRRAERRGKELATEQLAHVSSELKVYERTRLAVELHDSLSQTLTGVSMGIDSALDIAGEAIPGLKRQLLLTSKTVEACRTELRNCLWDLRSQALEEDDMNAAIALALGQIVNRKILSVRFNVPRNRLSDNTAHAILRIIRELASNAIRHGHATTLKVAGSIEGDKLRFSVRDNGEGFDPEDIPGIADGHFGLQGIRERIELLDGKMDVVSKPRQGTKVTITLNIPQEKMEGKTDG